VTERQPCSLQVDGLRIGEACPRCGHNSIFHPWNRNAVEACLLCMLEMEIERLKEKP